MSIYFFYGEKNALYQPEAGSLPGEGRRHTGRSDGFHPPETDVSPDRAVDCIGRKQIFHRAKPWIASDGNGYFTGQSRGFHPPETNVSPGRAVDCIGRKQTSSGQSDQSSF